MAYEINYEDQKFKDVEAEKDTAISDLEKTYNDIIDDSDDYYDKQIAASKEWEQKQTDLQNEKTDFAIQEIEQNKAEAKEDYNEEQSGAYTDWKKQSAKHGVNAEQIADMGMQNTGFSESSQVSMFNTYQHRVTAARESYTRIVADFDNSITEARLQNNAALAEIAYNAQKERLELSLSGFQYKNELILELSDKKTELEQNYYERWQDVLEQMNTENELAEEIRQFDEELAEEKRQFDIENSSSSSSSGSSGGGGYSYSYGGGGSGGSGSGGSGSKINKSSSSGSNKLSSETAKSIISLGQGPISSSNLASQVASGKVTESKSSSGNSVFSYSGSAALSGAKPATSSSSSGGVISKVVDTVKNWFK